MGKPARLSDDERADLARRFPRWEVTDTAMRRRFEFPDFVAAMGFVTKVALLAERAGHHPTWTNTYRTVDIELTTHDAGGLSARDRALAAEIERILGETR